MKDYQRIIDIYYKEDDPLREVLLTHSRQVADRALLICRNHPELGLDPEFVEAAAMLHDVGIIRCDAPSIHCHGTEPYICHGRLGAEMLRGGAWLKDKGERIKDKGEMINDKGELEALARVCERHTGAGLSKKEIVEQGLPLPHEDFLPETMVEQVICYADKFYSKTKLRQEKTIEQAERSLAKFGEEGLQRFRRWVQMFEGKR